MQRAEADGGRGWKPGSHTGIEMSLYKAEWKWWWDNSRGQGQLYVGQVPKPVKTGVINRKRKRALDFKIDYPEWGAFFVKAYDPVSGHGTGRFVYIDWLDGWNSQGDAMKATMLYFHQISPRTILEKKPPRVIRSGAREGRW